MPTNEYNFDGLIGPTHNFAGLGVGNVASQSNKHATSNPREAALQGLRKMRLLYDMGIKQAIIPPHERPLMEALWAHDYRGSEKSILEKVSRDNYNLLLSISSASAMWSANAATISPSMDCHNHRLNFTPANLLSQSHRAMETKQTTIFLQTIFSELGCFTFHPALPDDGRLFDEGAANHMRLASSHADKGIEIFVYGRSIKEEAPQPSVYPARQSFEASDIIAKTHLLDAELTITVQQNPKAIDKGVFHNDVIAVSNENVLFYHELAFVDTKAFIEELKKKYKLVSDQPLHLIEIKSSDLSLDEVVASYIFNSQIVTYAKGEMAIVAPERCQEKKIKNILHDILQADNPIKKIYYVPLNESMRNGGGPACLRLRAVLTENESGFLHKGFLLDKKKFGLIESWINKRYRDHLHVDDLKDYELFKESRQALDELTQILNIGSVYAFQKT